MAASCWADRRLHFLSGARIYWRSRSAKPGDADCRLRAGRQGLAAAPHQSRVCGAGKGVKPNFMQTTLIVFMIIAAVGTLAVLARGIIIMARGQDVTGEQTNRMMSLRVALQALAIFFIVILFLINRPG
jgi:hypothetical protein